MRAAEAVQKQRSRPRRQTHQEFVYPDNNADVAAWLVPDYGVEFVDDDSDYEPDELLVVNTISRLRSRPSRGQGQR